MLGRVRPANALKVSGSCWRDAVGSSDAAAAPGAGESAIQTALQQVRQNPSDHRAYQHLSAAYAKDRQALIRERGAISRLF